MNENEKIIKRWLKLAEEFEERVRGKRKLGEILPVLREFAKEKELDFWDVEAITKLCYGELAGSFLFGVYIKSEGSKFLKE